MKKKLLTAILLVVASASWTNTLYGQEYHCTGYHEINGLFVYADRPLTPQYSHSLMFNIADMSWLPSTCNQTLIIVPDTEKTAVATLLSAQIANKPVLVYIDDALKVGPYCQATIIRTQ